MEYKEKKEKMCRVCKGNEVIEGERICRECFERGLIRRYTPPPFRDYVKPNREKIRKTKTRTSRDVGRYHVLQWGGGQITVPKTLVKTIGLEDKNKLLIKHVIEETEKGKVKKEKLVIEKL